MVVVAAGIVTGLGLIETRLAEVFGLMEAGLVVVEGVLPETAGERAERDTVAFCDMTPGTVRKRE